jgi:hypothetical protein
MRGRTTLIVAQRLSTARKADIVVVMDEGRIADLGSHEELLERSCLYAEIAASQLVADEELEIPDRCALEDSFEPGAEPAGPEGGEG